MRIGDLMPGMDGLRESLERAEKERRRKARAREETKARREGRTIRYLREES